MTNKKGAQSVKKLVFDRLTEVKEAPKTSNLHASAYVDTVAGKLRSKAKALAVQAFSALWHSVDNPVTGTSRQSKTPQIGKLFLPVWGFFDTLNSLFDKQKGSL